MYCGRTHSTLTTPYASQRECRGNRTVKHKKEEKRQEEEGLVGRRLRRREKKTLPLI